MVQIYSVIRIECPICSRVIENAPSDYGPRPFCSRQCKLADLSNWLNESYRIPTDDTEVGQSTN